MSKTYWITLIFIGVGCLSFIQTIDFDSYSGSLNGTDQLLTDPTNEVSENSILNSEDSIKYRPLFPEIGKVYSSNEITHFRWENDLDSTYTNRLIVATDSLLENKIVDTLMAPYKEYFRYYSDYPSDSPDSFLINLSLLENRFDLIRLLEKSTTYYWKLISSRDSSIYSFQSHFHIDTLSSRSFKNETGDDFRENNYNFAGKFAKVIIPVADHGVIKDLNIGFKLRQSYGCFDASYPRSIVLTSPSGTSVELTNNHEDLDLINYRSYDDEAFMSDSSYYATLAKLAIPTVELASQGQCLFVQLEHYPDLKLKPIKNLSTFKGEDAFGNWTLDMKMGELNGHVSDVILEMEMVDYPINLEVSKNDQYSSQLQWHSQKTYNSFSIQRTNESGEFISIGEVDGVADKYLDTALAEPNKLVSYRIRGASADTSQYSHLVKYKTWLSQPAVVNKIPFEFYAKDEYPYDIYYWGVKITWENQYHTADGFLIDRSGTITKTHSLPEELTGTFSVAAYHQFDTSDWSLPVSYSFNLLYPENGSTISTADLGRFDWESDLREEGTLVIQRTREGNADHYFDATQNFNLNSEQVRNIFLDTGTYYWKIVLAGFNVFGGGFSKIGEFRITEIPLAVSAANTFKIWPNPTSEGLFLNTNDHKPKFVEIFDLAGKNHLNFHFEESSIQLDIHTLKAGIYIIKVNSTSEKFSQKLIIEKK